MPKKKKGNDALVSELLNKLTKMDENTLKKALKLLDLVSEKPVEAVDTLIESVDKQFDAVQNSIENILPHAPKPSKAKSSRPVKSAPDVAPVHVRYKSKVTGEYISREQAEKEFRERNQPPKQQEIPFPTSVRFKTKQGVPITKEQANELARVEKEIRNPSPISGPKAPKKRRGGRQAYTDWVKGTVNEINKAMRRSKKRWTPEQYKHFQERSKEVKRLLVKKQRFGIDALTNNEYHTISRFFDLIGMPDEKWSMLYGSPDKVGEAA